MGFFYLWGNSLEVHGELKNWLAGAVAAVGYQFWGAEIIHSGNRGTLRVYIDAENGINIDDCEKASRQISAVLEVEQPLLSEFTLEVSSPGFYRPLFIAAHYQKFIGEPIKLRLKRAMDLNRKNFAGTLTKANDEKITLIMDGEEFTFELDNIAQAHLDPKL